MKHSENLVLVKASSGTAPGVAAALDAAELEGILAPSPATTPSSSSRTGEPRSDALVDTLNKFRGVR